MLTGNLRPRSRRADYTETLQLTETDTDSLVDFNVPGLVSDGSVTLSPVGGRGELVATWGGDFSSPSLGVLYWRFRPDALAGFLPGPHRLRVSLTAAGEVVELVDAILPLT